MNIKADKKVAEIVKYLKSQSPKSHPLKEHPIVNLDEFFAERYIDMLCLIAQYKCDDLSNQIDFIERIMAAFNDSITFNEHSLRAMSIKDKEISEFLNNCQENNVSNLFFVESVIISSMNGKPCEEKIKFLSQLANIYAFDKEYLEIILKISVSIMEQNKEKYDSVVSKLDERYTSIIRESLVYIKTFVEGVIVCNQELLYVYYKECNEYSALYKGELDDCLYDTRNKHDYGFMTAYIRVDNVGYCNSNYYMIINTKTKHKDIIFENVYLNSNINFGYSQSLILIGCKITGQIRSYAEKFFRITNSHFINGPEKIYEKNSSLIIFCAKEFVVKNSCFIHCKSVLCDYGSPVLFYHGKKYNQEIITMTIENCLFKNCYSICTQNFRHYDNATVLIAEEADITARNCKIINCGYFERSQLLFRGGKYSGENNVIEGTCIEYKK